MSRTKPGIALLFIVERIKTDTRQSGLGQIVASAFSRGYSLSRE